MIVIACKAGYGPQQRRHRQLALAIDFYRKQMLIAGLELQPRAAIGNELARKKSPARRGILIRRKVDAGRTHQLAHDYAFGAIDDERSFTGHQREITHEDFLLDDFARFFVSEPRLHIQRSRVRGIMIATFVFAVLRYAKGVRRQNEFKAETLAGKIFNGRNFRKNFV